jgi:hypothetical protein
MEWFISLPLPVQIVSVILFLVLLFGLGYIGKVNLKFGRNIISFGRTPKRSCADCILVLFGKRERLEVQRSFFLNRILKEQMNFAEQKILEVQSILLAAYRDMLSKKRTADISSSEENKQYRLYQGILFSALMSIKDELRRSFKENGFENLHGNDFSAYVKSKSMALISIGRDHINDLYPYDGMLITNKDRMEVLENLMPKFEGMCFDLFSRAKEIKIETKKKASELEQEFANEIDEFVRMRQ